MGQKKNDLQSGQVGVGVDVAIARQRASQCRSCDRDASRHADYRAGDVGDSLRREGERGVRCDHRSVLFDTSGWGSHPMPRDDATLPLDWANPPNATGGAKWLVLRLFVRYIVFFFPSFRIFFTWFFFFYLFIPFLAPLTLLPHCSLVEGRQ